MTIGDISHAAEVEGEPLGRTEDVLRGMFRAAREALDGPDEMDEDSPYEPKTVRFDAK